MVHRIWRIVAMVVLSGLLTAYGSGGNSGGGVSWMAQASGTNNFLFGVAYGGSGFVAVGGGTVLTSP